MYWMMVLGALFCIIAGTASADVSHEVIVGLEGDSSTEIKSSLGSVSVDLSDKVKEKSSQFLAQYSYFLTPLTDDGKNIELRRFYQHPSAVSAALISLGSTREDSRTNLDATGSASLLAVGGEYFFPTDTGVFLLLGGGSGTNEQTVNGVASPNSDVKLGISQFGVRQYVAPSVELHLAFHGESMKAQQAGQPDTKSKQNVALLGIRGVIQEAVGLSLEFGGGEREDDDGTQVDKFDVSRINLGIAGYIGTHFSLALDLEAEAAKQSSRLPAGVTEYTEATSRATLSFTYWFSERFGMQLPIYSKATENKTVTTIAEMKDTTKSSGVGLYAGFRF